MSKILIDVEFNSKINAYIHEEIANACHGKYRLIKAGKSIIVQSDRGEVVLSIEHLFFAMMNAYKNENEVHPAIKALEEIAGTTRCGDDCGKTCYCGEESCIDKLHGIAEKALEEIKK